MTGKTLFKNKKKNAAATGVIAGTIALLAFLGAWTALAVTDIITFYDTDSKKLAAFKIEVADNDENRAMGLMHRESLDKDRGMLFIFDRPQIVSMWMKNTKIPLDMIYIDESGTVKCIRKNTVPESLKSLTCTYKTLYVLEINAGLADAYGIKVGHKSRLRTH